MTYAYSMRMQHMRMQRILRNTTCIMSISNTPSQTLPEFDPLVRLNSFSVDAGDDIPINDLRNSYCGLGNAFVHISAGLTSPGICSIVIVPFSTSSHIK